ncbi:MAG: arylsulfatase, partial [Clostridia bacterium]
MQEKGRPNVLLFMADQWRGDCLGVVGHPDVKTPFLDTLANEGVCFTHAYSAVPSCIAARAAMHTGQYQAHHGRVGYKDGVAWRYPHTMAGTFTQAGYQTQCVGKMHVHPLRSRQGFENIELHDGFLHYYQNNATPHFTHQTVADDYCHMLDGLCHHALADTGLECNGWPTRAWIYPEEQHPTHWAGDRALDFLRRRDRDCPFFLNVSFVRPHPPFDAPEAYCADYRTRRMTKPPVGDWAKENGPTHHCGADGIADPVLLEQAQRGYYACMTQVDHQIGRILEVLRTDGELANTYVMFVSDHGEMMGDHHLFRKALPYEGSAHVPLLIAGPGIPKGRRIDAVAELMDVMPTLLSAAGIPTPETVDGSNLLSLLAPDAAWRKYVHGEHEYGDRSNHYLVSSDDK